MSSKDVRNLEDRKKDLTSTIKSTDTKILAGIERDKEVIKLNKEIAVQDETKSGLMQEIRAHKSNIEECKASIQTCEGKLATTKDKSNEYIRKRDALTAMNKPVADLRADKAKALVELTQVDEKLDVRQS
jgi:predicted  nucleic acid-binding Zn-ribbon protein